MTTEDEATQARHDRLLPIALLTLEDPKAIEVLGDAVQEADWYDARVLVEMDREPGRTMQTLEGRFGRTELDELFSGQAQRDPSERKKPEKPERRWAKLVASPTLPWARAVAAVLLFGGWTLVPWPGLMRLLRESWASRRPPGGAGRVREFPLSFPSTTIAPGATARIGTQPQVAFRGRRLIVPSDIAGSIVIQDLLVGNVSMFVGGNAVPGMAFSEQAFPVDLTMDTAQISQMITIIVTNTSVAPVTFNAAIIGLTVE